MERMLRKNRRSPAISDSKTHPFPSRNSAYDGSSVEGAEPPNGRSGSTSNSPKKHAKSPAAKRPATSVANGSPATTAENLHRRSVSDSPPTTPQVLLLIELKYYCTVHITVYIYSFSIS